MAKIPRPAQPAEVGKDIKVQLRGERVWARCVAVRPNGNWMGIIKGHNEPFKFKKRIRNGVESWIRR